MNMFKAVMIGSLLLVVACTGGEIKPQEGQTGSSAEGLSVAGGWSCFAIGPNTTNYNPWGSPGLLWADGPSGDIFFGQVNSLQNQSVIDFAIDVYSSSFGSFANFPYVYAAFYCTWPHGIAGCGNQSCTHYSGDAWLVRGGTTITTEASLDCGADGGSTAAYANVCVYSN
jgi:hypothetical protein